MTHDDMSIVISMKGNTALSVSSRSTQKRPPCNPLLNTASTTNQPKSLTPPNRHPREPNITLHRPP